MLNPLRQFMYLIMSCLKKVHINILVYTLTAGKRYSAESFLHKCDVRRNRRQQNRCSRRGRPQYILCNCNLNVGHINSIEFKIHAQIPAYISQISNFVTEENCSAEVYGIYMYIYIYTCTYIVLKILQVESSTYGSSLGNEQLQANHGKFQYKKKT